MNKQEALNRLSALESEAKALREIIEAPEKVEGLWRPAPDGKYYTLDGGGDIVEYTVFDDAMDRYAMSAGRAFLSRKIAEKAAPLMVRANKIIAAALQADPDAGPHGADRRHTACMSNGRWYPDSWSVPTASAIPAHVHTEKQAREMCRILNAEGVK